MDTSRYGATRADRGAMNALRLLAYGALALLAGCATGPSTVFSPSPLPPAETGHYETAPGREPALIADLRATAPPAQPEIVEGKNLAADEKRLGAQSYMRIGMSHFAASDSEARAKAERQGQHVGADRVIVYPPGTSGDVVVAYYVRFKLPFGATFRDLKPAEMSELGTGGGVAIGSVVEDSPASRANLLTGDIVLKCDDKAIIDRADFQSRLRAKAGHPVTLTIVRNGETLQRVVRLGPMANAS